MFLWKMDSYVQTGYGIVPTRYLVDNNKKVQLITMGAVSWALTASEDAKKGNWYGW